MPVVIAPVDGITVGTRERWRVVGRAVAATSVPRLVVMGGCDSGKTTFFSEQVNALAPEDMRFVHWDAAGGRCATPEAFWETVRRHLGVRRPLHPGSAHADLAVALEDAALAPRTVLVIDNWDDAQELGRISYEDLESLTTFILGQEEREVPGQALLGFVLVTRFPTTQMLLRYAHRVRNPGLSRVSGCLEQRAVTGVHFPMLSLEASVELVVEVIPEAEPFAREIALDVGGWPGLLIASARRAVQLGGWSSRARTFVREQVVPTVLGKSLLPGVERDQHLGSYADAWAHVHDEVRGGDALAFAEWGLPRRFSPEGAHEPALPPVLAEYTPRPGRH